MNRQVSNSKNRRWKVTSACDDRHLLRMVVNDRTASSRQLAALWSTATDESRFNLWAHDSRIRVRRSAGERCLPECVIERHSGLTPGVNGLRCDLPIEHTYDLVGLARDPRPAASKDELLLRIQVIWNSLPQADIQNLPRRIAAVIAARSGYTKY
ncbi:transposable element Tcb2 transposase [Trichonephila clavipes]|nr:transposable element Tcb2 transposase [Trichonephila clavipes]